jgi:hypothetical protein
MDGCKVRNGLNDGKEIVLYSSLSKMEKGNKADRRKQKEKASLEWSAIKWNELYAVN